MRKVIIGIRSLLCAFLCLVMVSPFAFADNKANAVTFTVGGGYIFFSPKRNLKNTAIPGMAALAYNFTDKWAMEFAANLINANSGDPSKHFVHGFIYLLDVLYRLHSYRGLDPYVMGGFNVTSLKPISSQPVNQGGMNIGIGTEFFKSRYVSLSVGARDVLTFSGMKNDILLNGGVNFKWE